MCRCAAYNNNSNIPCTHHPRKTGAVEKNVTSASTSMEYKDKMEKLSRRRKNVKEKKARPTRWLTAFCICVKNPSSMEFSKHECTSPCAILTGHTECCCRKCYKCYPGQETLPHHSNRCVHRCPCKCLPTEVKFTPSYYCTKSQIVTCKKFINELNVQDSIHFLKIFHNAILVHMYTQLRDEIGRYKHALIDYFTFQMRKPEKYGKYR